MAWRISGGIATVLFVVFAAVQIDDPDPLLWIALYLGAAAVSLPLARARPVPRWGPLIIGVFAAELAIMGQLFPPTPELSMGGPSWLGGETTRELLGCVVVLSWATAVSLARPFHDGQEDLLLV